MRVIHVRRRKHRAVVLLPAWELVDVSGTYALSAVVLCET